MREPSGVHWAWKVDAWTRVTDYGEDVGDGKRGLAPKCSGVAFRRSGVGDCAPAASPCPQPAAHSRRTWLHTGAHGASRALRSLRMIDVLPVVRSATHVFTFSLLRSGRLAG